MECYEKYLLKDNNNVVGNAKILQSARDIIEEGDYIMVPLTPMEDIEETEEDHVASNSPCSSRNQEKEEDQLNTSGPIEISSDSNESESDSSTSFESGDEQERMEANATDKHIDEEVPPKTQHKNSPMIFAIQIDDQDSGPKTKVKCWLCNKVMQKGNFHRHINAVHTSNYEEGKCEICGKLMLKDCLPKHRREVHIDVVHTPNDAGSRRKKGKCEICGKLVFKLSRHRREVHFDEKRQK